jgi:catechol 2,3-dioxygenase-like lactoylglutathione lyase family enzyme
VPIDSLIAYAHVEDVDRSVAFYRRLGLEVENTHAPEGRLAWAFMTRGDAKLMLALADGPIDAGGQAVLFYCWTRDVRALHDELTAAGLEVGPVTHPFYMPAGELRVEDPDGYVVLVGQLGEGS